MSPPECIVFDSAALLPAAWRHFSAEGPVRTFNPALLRDGDGWIFAYRVVGPDGLRRIALCRLDAMLRIVAGSQVATTDHVRFPPDRDGAEQGTTWFADPRLYRLAGRLFVYWNSGWHEPRNRQFVQELDAANFRPVGRPRELMLRGERQALEKNWTLFGDGPFRAVYSVTPHRVLDFSIEGDGDIEFAEISTENWDNDAYAGRHGALRGGAPPQLSDGHYWSFCHSVYSPPDGHRYVAAVYRFAPTAPFAPTGAPIAPLALGNPFGPRRLYPKLNPAVGEVIYPCGAALRDGRWVVSYGINDEHCAIAILPQTEVLAALRPLAPPA